MQVAERWSRIKECNYVPVKVANTRADLGESLVWDERSGVLYFVDISGGRINGLTPMAKSIAFTSLPRALAPWR